MICFQSTVARDPRYSLKRSKYRQKQAKTSPSRQPNMTKIEAHRCKMSVRRHKHARRQRDAIRDTKMQAGTRICELRHGDASKSTKMQAKARRCKQKHEDASRNTKMQAETQRCKQKHNDASRNTMMQAETQ